METSQCLLLSLGELVSTMISKALCNLAAHHHLPCPRTLPLPIHSSHKCLLALPFSNQGCSCLKDFVLAVRPQNFLLCDFHTANWLTPSLLSCLSPVAPSHFTWLLLKINPLTCPTTFIAFPPKSFSPTNYYWYDTFGLFSVSPS